MDFCHNEGSSPRNVIRRRRTTPHENSFSEDIVGEFDFRKDVPSFSSTKSDRYSPIKKKKSMFLWYISPLFEFANNILVGFYLTILFVELYKIYQFLKPICKILLLLSLKQNWLILINTTMFKAVCILKKSGKRKWHPQ